MSGLALYLFGPPRVELDGEPIHVPRRKALALLAYLALGERYSRDALAALLWPEHDHIAARAGLRRTLSALNGALGRGWLALEDDTVSLRRDGRAENHGREHPRKYPRNHPRKYPRNQRRNPPRHQPRYQPAVSSVPMRSSVDLHSKTSASIVSRNQERCRGNPPIPLANPTTTCGFILWGTAGF